MINLDDIDITQTPPTHEPERQYYYMAKARQYVKKKSEELGRPLTLFLKTFAFFPFENVMLSLSLILTV